ncbi:MAG: hypothetical protein ABIL09_28730, partial [Gemmatimonadota bacterium]
DLAAPRSAADLLELLRLPQRDDELVVELYRAEEGLSVDGRELPGLPLSARAVLQADPSAGRVGAIHGRVLARARLATPFALSGEQVAQLSLLAPQDPGR